MPDSVVKGLFALAGILLGSVLSWLLNRQERIKTEYEIQHIKAQTEKTVLENRELHLRLKELQLRQDEQRITMQKLRVDTQHELKKYLSTLVNDLNIWQGGLGLGRTIEMEDIYVWVDLENDGERRGEKFRDADLFDYLITRKKDQHALIIGGPGSGKSTLIRKWAHGVAKSYLEGQSRLLPLFISLHQLGQLRGKPMQNIAVEEMTITLFYGEQGILYSGLRTILKEEMANGNVIIFLDAADEVPLAMRDILVPWINKMSGSTNCKVVLTSRPCTYIDQINNFEKYNMVEFDSNQITAFVDRWFETANRDADTKKDIVKTVLNSPLVLKSNPLFLTLLCVVTEHGSLAEELPSAGALFERFVRELLQHRAQKHELSVETKTKLYLLQSIACLLFESDRRFIQEEQLLEEAEKAIACDIGKENLKNTVLIIKEIVETSGILRYNRIGYYGFYHPLFQDFFVARKLKQDIDNGAINATEWFEKHAFEQRYSNIFAFLCELIDFNKRVGG